MWNTDTLYGRSYKGLWRKIANISTNQTINKGPTHCGMTWNASPKTKNIKVENWKSELKLTGKTWGEIAGGSSKRQFHLSYNMRGYPEMPWLGVKRKVVESIAGAQWGTCEVGRWEWKVDQSQIQGLTSKEQKGVKEEFKGWWRNNIRSGKSTLTSE